MRTISRLFLRGALLVAALACMAAASGCGRGEIHRLVAPPAARQTTGDPELFATGPPRAGTKIAVVSSASRTGLDDATMARHVRDVRSAARRAGADAVIDVRLLTVKKHGYVSDPAPPFPGAKQADYASYIMRGTAIVYTPDPEDVPVAESDASTVDAEGATPPAVSLATP